MCVSLTGGVVAARLKGELPGVLYKTCPDHEPRPSVFANANATMPDQNTTQNDTVESRDSFRSADSYSPTSARFFARDVWPATQLCVGHATRDEGSVKTRSVTYLATDGTGSSVNAMCPSVSQSARTNGAGG